MPEICFSSLLVNILKCLSQFTDVFALINSLEFTLLILLLQSTIVFTCNPVRIFEVYFEELDAQIKFKSNITKLYGELFRFLFVGCNWQGDLTQCQRISRNRIEN